MKPHNLAGMHGKCRPFLILLLFVIGVRSHALKNLYIYPGIENETVSEDLMKPLVCIEAGFGPKRFELLTNLTLLNFDDVACKQTDKPSTFPAIQFAAVVHRPGCSYVHKALQAQRWGARALIVLNDEFSVGMLFAMLDDRSGNAHEVLIPAVMLEKEDGDRIQREMNDNNVQLNVTLSSASDHRIQEAWEVYVLMWPIMHLVVGCLAVLEFIIVLRLYTIKHVVTIIVALCCLSSFATATDLWWDHWNLRGTHSRMAVFITNSLSINFCLLEHSLTTYLWICVLNDKRNLRKKKLDLRPKFLAFVLITPLIMDCGKLIIYGAGASVLTSFTVYNVAFGAWLCLLASMCCYSSWKSRQKALAHIKGTDRQLKMIFWHMSISTMGYLLTSVSLLMWSGNAALFGVWSWCIFHTYWRFGIFVYNLMTLVCFFPKLPLQVLLKTLLCMATEQTSHSLPSRSPTSSSTYRATAKSTHGFADSEQFAEEESDDEQEEDIAGAEDNNKSKDQETTNQQNLNSSNTGQQSSVSNQNDSCNENSDNCSSGDNTSTVLDVADVQILQYKNQGEGTTK